MLAFLYLNGLGAVADAKEAFYWFESSAKQGVKEAWFILGGMYYEGNGTIRDLEKSLY